MFNLIELESDLDCILNKKRQSKKDKEFLNNYIDFIRVFMGTLESELESEHGLSEDDIARISSFLEVRLSVLLKKDRLRKIESEELRALYSSAQWRVITTWTKTQEQEIEEELKKTNIGKITLYKAPWKWSLYWP